VPHDQTGFEGQRWIGQILKEALVEWRSQCLYDKKDDFVFPSERLKGKKPLDLASVLKRKIQPAFKSVGICGVGWHTFRHTVGTVLAEMGEHQLTIRDYLPQQSSCHQQIPAGDIEDEAVGTGEVGRGDYASGGIPSETNSCPMIVNGGKKEEVGTISAYRPLISPDLGLIRVASA